MQLVASVAAGSGELASTSGAGQTGREGEPADTSTDDSSLYDPWTQVECSYQVDSSGEPLDLGDQADYQTDSSDWTEDQFWALALVRRQRAQTIWGLGTLGGALSIRDARGHHGSKQFSAGCSSR